MQAMRAKSSGAAIGPVLDGEGQSYPLASGKQAGRLFYAEQRLRAVPNSTDNTFPNLFGNLS
jgi:hypothetical protein